MANELSYKKGTVPIKGSADHLGNVREVVGDDGTLEQVNNYYPFGAPFTDNATSAKSPDLQPYKYTGKELDLTHGLNTYDHGARQNYSILGVWDRIDSLAEKYYNVSPYVVCGDNPVVYKDNDGKNPGDFFETADEAALDFARLYNVYSITQNIEYSSIIYQTTNDWNNRAYTYTTPYTDHQIDGVRYKYKSVPMGKSIVALIHTHGDEISGYNNNVFSAQDKSLYRKIHLNGYLVTPNGLLLKHNYNPNGTKLVAGKNNGIAFSEGKNPKTGRTIKIGGRFKYRRNEETQAQRRKNWYRHKASQNWWDRNFYQRIKPRY